MARIIALFRENAATRSVPERTCPIRRWRSARAAEAERFERLGLADGLAGGDLDVQLEVVCPAGAADHELDLVAAALVGVGAEGARRPFTHVALHVLEAKGALALGEAAHRRGERIAVVAIEHGRPHPTALGAVELALVAAHVDEAVRRAILAPGEAATVGAARGVLPLALGGEALAGPVAVGGGLVVIDAVDGVI